MSGKIDYAAFTGIIRDRISAADIGRDYGLNPGRDGRCKCIFCSGDRKDTLRLYPGNRGAYCFRCHKSADVIALVMEITGQNFPQAVKELNERYGLNLPLDKPDPEKTRKAREEAERKRKEQTEKEEREKRLLTALWDVSDKVWTAEQILRSEGPASPEEPFSERYVAAAESIHLLREERDRIFDELYGKFFEERRHM